jgi:hypothetical protein
MVEGSVSGGEPATNTPDAAAGANQGASREAEAAGNPLPAAQAIQGRETDGDALEEEEDEEPRLKYQRLGSSVTDILRQDAASCLCVSDKLLALGTHDGTIHVLDYAGNEASRSFIRSSPWLPCAGGGGKGGYMGGGGWDAPGLLRQDLQVESLVPMYWCNN